MLSVGVHTVIMAIVIIMLIAAVGCFLWVVMRETKPRYEKGTCKHGYVGTCLSGSPCEASIWPALREGTGDE